MKVGDYVRTEYGIAKYIKDLVTKQTIYFVMDKPIIYDNVEGSENLLCNNEIIKSSPNIIDLIEVGDLVRIEVEKDNTNVFEVCAINYNDNEIGVFNNNFEFDWASIEQVKSIVTKEQFESMEYKVKE